LCVYEAARLIADPAIESQFHIDESRKLLLLIILRELREILISVGHRTWSRKIESFQFSNLKFCRRDELVYLTFK
jgi:hypothetical protein